MRTPKPDEIDSFIKGARNLAEICDKKLWRGEYKSFSEYCEKQWSLDPVQVFEMIALADEVQTEGTVMNDLVAEWRRQRERS